MTIIMSASTGTGEESKQERDEDQFQSLSSICHFQNKDVSSDSSGRSRVLFSISFLIGRPVNLIKRFHFSFVTTDIIIKCTKHLIFIVKITSILI